MIKDNPVLYRPLKTDPSPLTDLATSYRIYEAVSAAVSLELFKYLKTQKTPGQLAGELNLDEKAVSTVFEALASIGALKKDGEKFSTTPLADDYLIKESILYLGQEFETGSFGNQLLKVLTAKGEGACHKSPLDKERLRQIGAVGLTGSIQNTVASCDLSYAQSLLDLGGGHGFFSIAFAQKYPSLKVTIFDLPEIIPLAEEFVRQFSLESRISFGGGDFLKDDIGSGYDAILCSNVLHGKGRNILIAKVHESLKPNGKLIVKTRIGDAPGNLANRATALLLQVRGAKELFDFPQWKSFLESNDFREVEMKGLTGMFATITARKGEKRS